jgi:hypothetical protein
MEGKLKKQDVIDDQVHKTGKQEFDIQVCMTRLGGLDQS